MTSQATEVATAAQNARCRPGARISPSFGKGAACGIARWNPPRTIHPAFQKNAGHRCMGRRHFSSVSLLVSSKFLEGNRSYILRKSDDVAPLCGLTGWDIRITSLAQSHWSLSASFEDAGFEATVDRLDNLS